MDTNSLPLSSGMQAKTRVYAAELAEVFKQYVDKIKVLSLDCFDTLLWRKTVAPRDVFHDLSQAPLFSKYGFSALMRTRGETLACQLKRVQEGSTQATLQDIYRAIFSDLNLDAINELVAAELAQEIEACFAFQPVVDLIRLAKQCNKKIIIVSDTYLQETQLKTLLESKLPQDVMAMIDKIFCSCDHGRGKAEGLFESVINKLYLPANNILHLGDNLIADFNAAKAMGMSSLHFVQHSNNISELIRMQSLATGYIDSTFRTSRSLCNPYRALFAMNTSDLPENIVGYASLGPVMYSFARFVCDEVEALRLAGKKVKVLFLMRDAYLPALICETLTGQPIGANVRISRFAAIASSFRTVNDIDLYLAENISSFRYEDMCKQLLLSPETTKHIIAKTKAASQPAEAFAKLIHKNENQDFIFKASTAYRARLKLYLEKQVALEAGDTLMFVDLGYTGTAQIKLAPVFKDEMDVEIIGRYLISLRSQNWLETRKGLIDARHYSDNVLTMLVTYIALIEQLSTSSEHSTIEFNEDGDPIYGDHQIAQQQLDALKNVQAECVRFAREVEDYLSAINVSLSATELRDAAILSLTRFLFLPSKNELQFLQAFQHDVNLGTNEVIPIFNVQQGIQSLRKRSWLYCLKENLKTMRMNYSAEWRAANLELVMTLMAQQSFDFEVALSDLSHIRETVDIAMLNGDGFTMIPFDALPTYNGYFSVIVPAISGGQFGICFGAKYKWVEIDSAELIPLTHLYTTHESAEAKDASEFLAIEKMEDKTGGLFECVSKDSMLYFVAPKKLVANTHVLRVIFRPIV